MSSIYSISIPQTHAYIFLPIYGMCVQVTLMENGNQTIYKMYYLNSIVLLLLYV